MLGLTTEKDIQDSYFLTTFIQQNTDLLDNQIHKHKWGLNSANKKAEDLDILQVARNLFDLREFKKASYLLKEQA